MTKYWCLERYNVNTFEHNPVVLMSSQFNVIQQSACKNGKKLTLTPGWKDFGLDSARPHAGDGNEVSFTGGIGERSHMKARRREAER